MNRKTLIEKLKMMIGETHPLIKPIENIMKYNYIRIKNDVETGEIIKQTNGVLQGDPISPTLFNILTADCQNIINGDQTTIIMYADDMVIGSQNKVELQETVNKLEEWAHQNQLAVNEDKTFHMTFRKGGRRAAEDTITLAGSPLKTVNRYKYLGITMQTTATSFSIHVQDRTAAAIKAIYNIKNLTKLTTDTAMTLFHTTIAPIVTYGIEIIWQKLTVSDLNKIEKVKASFMKRITGTGKTAPSRLIYELMRETYFIEDIRITYLLPSTEPYQKAVKVREQKRKEINEEFYTSSAMTDRNWTRECQTLRHVVTRLAIHGFHHKVCENKKFHQPTEDCRCALCGDKCKLYHITECKNRTKSINEYSKE